MSSRLQSMPDTTAAIVHQLMPNGNFFTASCPRSGSHPRSGSRDTARPGIMMMIPANQRAGPRADFMRSPSHGPRSPKSWTRTNTTHALRLMARALLERSGPGLSPPVQLPFEQQIALGSRGQLFLLPRAGKRFSDSFHRSADESVFHMARKMPVPLAEGDDLAISCAHGCVPSRLSIDDAADDSEVALLVEVKRGTSCLDEITPVEKARRHPSPRKFRTQSCLNWEVRPARAAFAMQIPSDPVALNDGGLFRPEASSG